MTSRKPGTLGKLSDYYTPQRNDDILASIDGVNVEVASATVRTQKGQRGEYSITQVALVDGRVFTVTGSRIAEALSAVPPEAWPIVCGFRSQPSAFDEGGVFWTVE